MSNHPALKFPLEARVDYAQLVASIMIIDGAINAVEVEDLQILCTQLQLPDADTRRVLAYAANPDTGHTSNLFQHILGSELKYALIIDLVVAAIADGRYADTESRRVHSLAKRLGVTEEQSKAIEKKVLTSSRRRTTKTEISEIAHDPDPLAGSLLGAVLPTLAAILVPAFAMFAVQPQATVAMAGLDDGEIVEGGLTVPEMMLDGFTRLGFGGGPVVGVIMIFVLSLLAYVASRAAIARAYPDAR